MFVTLCGGGMFVVDPLDRTHSLAAEPCVDGSRFDLVAAPSTGFRLALA